MKKEIKKKEVFEIKKNHVYLIAVILIFVGGVFAVGPLIKSQESNTVDPMASHHSGTGNVVLPAEKKFSFNEAVGKKAPEFSLEGVDGKTVKLSDFLGKNVVLFFNEGGMCYPACWNQIEELAKDQRFNNENTVVFSVVVDNKSEIEKIIKQVPEFGNAKILLDSSRKTSAEYDVLFLPSSMHKGSFPGHTYFVINKKGIIRFTLDDPRMGIWNDKLAEEINKINKEQ
jgi:peroxiredoxin Q/BCP